MSTHMEWKEEPWLIPTFSETLNSLPYMDAVIRETLRLNAPAPGTLREAKQDTVIPLSMPVIGRDGKQINSVRINKGTVVFIRTLYLHSLFGRTTECD